MTPLFIDRGLAHRSPCRSCVPTRTSGYGSQNPLNLCGFVSGHCPVCGSGGPPALAPVQLRSDAAPRHPAAVRAGTLVSRGTLPESTECRRKA